MDKVRSVREFSSAAGAQIFQIPLEVFPGFWSYAYLVLVDDLRVLIDTGSGFGDSNSHLEQGFKSAAGSGVRLPVRLEDLTHILITHGHIDHFGGLNYLKERTGAAIGVHALDRRNLTQHEERLVVAARNLERFLIEAGVRDENRQNLMAMYRFTKELFHSVQVDFTYDQVGMRLGPFEFLHVPGHCAGHVVIRLGDVLFSGDHVLAQISPHQAPEHLTLSTGLEHYLNSLDALESWAGPVKLTLGGHQEPVLDLPVRLREIRALHFNRLERVKEFLNAPHTIDELSRHLFGSVHGYDILLALEEAGAHVEYLYQRGWLTIENLAQVDERDGLVGLSYRCWESGDAHSY